MLHFLLKYSALQKLVQSCMKVSLLFFSNATESRHDANLMFKCVTIDDV